jgi:hypothetical protein
MLQGIKDVRNLDDPGRSAPAFPSLLLSYFFHHPADPASQSAGLTYAQS